MRRILSILPILIATATIAAVACGSSNDSGFSEHLDSQARDTFATITSLLRRRLPRLLRG